MTITTQLDPNNGTDNYPLNVQPQGRIFFTPGDTFELQDHTTEKNGNLKAKFGVEGSNRTCPTTLYVSTVYSPEGKLPGRTVKGVTYVTSQLVSAVEITDSVTGLVTVTAVMSQATSAFEGRTCIDMQALAQNTQALNSLESSYDGAWVLSANLLRKLCFGTPYVLDNIHVDTVSP